MKECTGKCVIPAYCYADHPYDGTVIKIKRGESGYYTTDVAVDATTANAEIGVTPAQAEAMRVGSMFGWGVPGADPCQYV